MFSQIEDNFKNFHEMTEEFQQTLRHDDFTYSSELCTNKTWIDTFITTLIHLENSKYRSEPDTVMCIAKIDRQNIRRSASYNIFVIYFSNVFIRLSGTCKAA